MCKLSIIIPVYNGEKVLKRCLDSLLAQDFQDFEAIVVDDGSKDDSLKIMNEYAAKDKRIKAVHKENGGVSSTRNLALDKACGRYIQFMDVDDWLPFDSMKLMVRAIEENDSDMVIADFYRVVDEKASQKGSIRNSGLLSRNEYADKMMLTPADFYYGVLWNKLYKRAIIEKYHIRMDSNISYCEDMIFNLEYLLHVNTVYVLKAPVYYYVKTEGSLVDSNLNLESTIKMKTSVIRYYDEFYKNILDEQDYEARMPIIYSYLVAVSTDAFAIPFLDSTKKLGEESGSKLYYDEQLAESGLIFGYLSDQLLEKLLMPLASENKLDYNEIKILYYLYKKDKEASVEELCSLLRISMPNCTLALSKLTAHSFIRLSEIRLFNDQKVSFIINKEKMNIDFIKAEKDLTDILYQGLSPEEIKSYQESQKKIFGNIKKTLVKE